MKSGFLGIVAASLLFTASAHADKANNALVLALDEPIDPIDSVYHVSGVAQIIYNAVYHGLVSIDQKSERIFPALASEWKRVDDVTWEFKLQKGVTFHDGSPFDADDVVYLLNWVIDPKVLFRLKDRYTWIRQAEKIDSHTIRIVAHKPNALALYKLANTHIYPSDAHSALEKKETFGLKPIGTGAYRVTAFDPGQSVRLEARDNLTVVNETFPIPAIKRAEVRYLKDEQTRVASLMRGDIEMARVDQKEVVDGLRANPRLAVTAVNGLLYFYAYMDAANRSGVGVLKDQRVRQAIAHAVDRAEIRKHIVPGGETAYEMPSLCLPIQANCVATQYPDFDPGKAKKLLAEAGYANGFDIRLTAIARSRPIAEAISGYLRNVGIRASINEVTFPIYGKEEREGKNQILVMSFGSGGIPDAFNILNFHFGEELRDYARDARLTELIDSAEEIYDVEKRKSVIREALEITAAEVYNLPIPATPTLLVHSADLVIPNVSLSGYGALLNQLKWK